MSDDTDDEMPDALAKLERAAMEADTSDMDSPEYDGGQTVWFDRGFGPEKGDVFTHSPEKRMVAVLVGTLSMGDRYILHEAEVFESKEALETSNAVEKTVGDDS